MTITTKIKMTKARRLNLAKLALGLLRMRQKTVEFNMKNFYFYSRFPGHLKSRPDYVEYECGTACCALGFAPRFIGQTKPWEDWEEYGTRTILGPVDEDRSWIAMPLFDFLFAHDWPNDPKQFAARAFYVLENGGVPSVCSYQDTYPVPRAKSLEAIIQKLQPRTKR